MTRVRRLTAASAILTAAAVYTCTFVLGDPSRDKQRYHPGDENAALGKAGLLEEYQNSKFADQPVVTYNASDGSKLFAAQLFAKGVAAERTARDHRPGRHLGWTSPGRFDVGERSRAHRHRSGRRG